MNKFKYHIPYIIITIGIFSFSSFPGDKLPDLTFEFSDKLIHFSVYLMLMISFFIAIYNSNEKNFLKKNPIISSLIITVIYGATDEIHQYFVPNRSCDIWDFVANTLGALLAGYFIFIYLKKKQNNTLQENTI